MRRFMHFDGHGATKIRFQSLPNGLTFVSDLICVDTRGQWHERRTSGHWNFERILADYAGSIHFSDQWSPSHPEEGDEMFPDCLLIEHDQECFIALDSIGINFHDAKVWSSGMKKAEKVLARFVDRYFVKVTPQKVGGFFMMMMQNDRAMATHVDVPRPAIDGEADLEAHYGKGFFEWSQDLETVLARMPGKATILRGEPGTGKTTFIRRLMHRMVETHAFYYLPASQVGVFAAPNLLPFWLQENERLKDLIKVIVIEDAEALLAPRAIDNQQHLSILLNISDGLLGEMLKLHLIFTVNCPLERIDPAVIRPGRLGSYREFRRLDPTEAAHLASQRKLVLPEQESYSLAEIFCGQRVESSPERTVGFTP